MLTKIFLLGAATFALLHTGEALVARLEDVPNPCKTTGMKPFDYSQLLCMSVLFYEAQRSGELPGDQRLTWRGDSALKDGSDVGHDLTGGYFDAGDFVKFGFPMAFSTTLLAWGLIDFSNGYSSAGQTNHGKAAVKWATDYFLKCHTGHYEFYGTELAGETAAALAAAYMVFKFANEKRGSYSDSIPEVKDFYKSWNGFGDELLWAAAWLYRATGDTTYLDKAKEHWDEFDLGDPPTEFSWDSKAPGAYAVLALATGNDLYKNTLKTCLDNMRHDLPYTPAGLVFVNDWGSNRHAANLAMLAMVAGKLNIDASTNRQWAKKQIDYMLGDPLHSYVVGFGSNHPKKPHHASSSCPDMPEKCDPNWAMNQDGPNPQTLWGALVGGPSQDDSYSDSRPDYQHNEVACDYNAGFTGALAGLVEHH
ncbi:Endoglucanase B-like [Homarus americanus]|uniref:Endoglucanase n=1 Tax=Homarus americanus TaxID=6706 RepID=A0A8J5N777_HOMAM|nr:Endoglucanase B-like [Homarus americanus]